MAVIHEIVVGATKPPLVAYWEDESGAAIDLTGGSARLQGRSDALPGVQIDYLGVLTDPAEGQATFPALGTLVRQDQLDAEGLTDATFALRVLFTDTAGLFDWGDKIFLKFIQTPITAVAVLYNAARRGILDGTLSLSGDTLKFMLVSSVYVPDLDHATVSQVSADEISGTGYAAGFGGAGRKEMTGKAFLTNNVTNRASLDCDNPSWPAISAGTIGAIVIIKEVTNDGDSLPIAYIDVANFATTGATYTHVVPAEGIIVY
jgi:hypothetical protein